MRLYRTKLIELLTDPGQLALQPEHAEQLVGQMEDVVFGYGYDIVLKSMPEERPRATVFGPTHTMASRELVEGVIVRRYTALARGGTVWSEMPCCSRWAHLKADPLLEFAVRCQPCGLDYTAVLVDESDGGYLAVFTIEVDQAPIMSRRRPNARPIG